MKTFSVWLKETMDEEVDNIPKLAELWECTFEHAIDNLTKQWWEYNMEINLYAND